MFSCQMSEVEFFLFFREAFSGFDPEIVAKFSEKKINSICTDYGIEMSQVRGAVDNANRILEVIKLISCSLLY